ncbi:DUF1566 domain-containing protein [Desulfobacterium sp. N47]|uniref:Lcl C-terminal domain-containing protein n=1 Tax=uncultured Desulfobacterium sp. TaxID=201089 RepID=E1YDS4_9BACT|nr:hypothetical protein N47_G40420 [uncultured Desulfobacterium sp.]
MNRFIEHNEAVSDTQTRLMWTKNASLSEFPLTWSEALSFTKALNRSKHCGYSDWKLPNRKELFSLMSHETINPSLPSSHPFANVFSGYYWTSTSCARLPNQAWYIHLGGARVFKGMKHNSYMVWPVRIADTTGTKIFQTGQRLCYDESGDIIDCADTGQDGEFQSGAYINKSRFKENTDFVYDNAINLVWLKNADINGDMMDWKSAFDFVKKMNKESMYGYNDWRLPDIYELESLTDMNRHSPALPAGNPFINIKEFYWSSTTSMYDTQYAWALYLRDGAVGVGFKSSSEFHLWPVRHNKSKIM